MKYLFILLMMFPLAGLTATCHKPDGSVFSTHCEKFTTDGKANNVFIKWIHPTQREDNSHLSLHEIKQTKAEFKEMIDGHSHYSHVIVHGSANHALSMYKPPGTYEVVLTTFDTGNRESRPSTKKHIDTHVPVVITIPKPPSTVIIEIRFK